MGLLDSNISDYKRLSCLQIWLIQKGYPECLHRQFQRLTNICHEDQEIGYNQVNPPSTVRVDVTQPVDCAIMISLSGWTQSVDG